jgi:5-(carboxyamino)imidazole ribonucleotide mutase
VSKIQNPKSKMTSPPLIGIIMGSDSDLPTMKAAIEICEKFAVAYEVAIVSAHRTPERMVEYAQTAHQRGLKVIIAGAGGAAHLPGMVAALTPLPVIGVPVQTKTLAGVDSLYSIVQMPAGIPVATVAIGNATNAGLLAVQILATSDEELLGKVQSYRDSLKEMVLKKQARLEQVGYQNY